MISMRGRRRVRYLSPATRRRMVGISHGVAVNLTSAVLWAALTIAARGVQIALHLKGW